MIRTKLSQGKSKRPCRTGMIKQPKEIFLLTFNSFRDSNIFLCKISLLKIGVVKNMNKHKSEIVTFMRNFGDDFRNYFTTNSSWRIATNALKLHLYCSNCENSEDVRSKQTATEWRCSSFFDSFSMSNIYAKIISVDNPEPFCCSILSHSVFCAVRNSPGFTCKRNFLDHP